MRNLLLLLVVSTIAISKVSTEPSGCKGNCLDVDIPFLPHEICTKFCMCDHGRPVEMDCPANLHYSEEHHVCMNPEDANCDGERQVNVDYLAKNVILINNTITNNQVTDNNGNISAKEVSSKSPCLGKCGSSINYLAHKDADKFCLCYFGNKIIMKCQSGAYFVPQLNNCIQGADLQKHDVRKAECMESCPQHMKPDTIYLLPNTDCRKYCVCILEYYVVIHSCPSDKLFSWPEKLCLDKKIANCANPDYNPKSFHLRFY